MREHKILIWCDVHSHRGEADEPATHTLSMHVSQIEGGPPTAARQIDICQKCMDEIAGLVQVVDDQGVMPGDAPVRHVSKPAARTKQQSSYPGVCPMCGDHYEWLATHISSVHKISVSESTSVKGGKWACPECGETFGGTQPLGIHATREHGAPTAVLLARKQAAA